MKAFPWTEKSAKNTSQMIVAVSSVQPDSHDPKLAKD